MTPAKHATPARRQPGEGQRLNTSTCNCTPSAAATASIFDLLDRIEDNLNRALLLLGARV
jgi:hypothetical protein